MSERIQKIQEALTSAHHQLNGILDQVGDRWQTPVYSEGAAWNIYQLLAHLAISAKGLNNQVVGISEGREVIPADFDLERFNRRSVEKRSESPVEELRQELDRTHQELMTWVSEVKDEAVLEKQGRHASMRIMSVEEILYEIATHSRHHATDIANVLGGQ